MITSTSEATGFSIFSQLNELRDAWNQQHSKRAEGGRLAISGFEHQFLLTLLKIVQRWKQSTEAERQDWSTAQEVLAEAISDITESRKDITFTQVKRTLSDSGLREALEELWEIFNLAVERTPDLAERLRFVISGKFEGHENPRQVIDGWKTRSESYPQQKLKLFKERVRYELVPDPEEDLSTELISLARDENTKTTIARWLGYLLQLGSGSSPESISTLIWKELVHDGSIEAFRATLKRLFDQSQKRLCAIRETLGERITLPRAELSELRAALLERKITLLIGPSGSGKSALYKVGIQQDFKQNFDCLFLHAADIASFTESSDVIANRELRRLDELLIARITQKPTLVIIDDLSDVGDRDFEAVLNLLKNTLTADTSSDARFILIAHVEAKHRIKEKISARFGNNSSCAEVELSQLPIEELQSSTDLPQSIINLSHRHREFGPALNLKLMDWLVRSVQKDQVDVSGFKNDLDLLTWFWCDYVQDGKQCTDLGKGLVCIATELATKFTPDLSCFDLSIAEETLYKLVRRDCLRVTDNRLAVTHRFVGDCARFHYLLGNRREIESTKLVERSKNPLWVQPIRWFVLQLVVKPEEQETWKELVHEALLGGHMHLLDLLLEGAILSKQPGSVLQGCPKESLPLVITRLITRLLAVATEPHAFHRDIFESSSLPTRIALREQITGLPKPDLWEPVWHWLLSQNPEIIVEDSCIIFKAAEAWLNWSIDAEKFSLRVEVAKFTLDLAQRLLLPERKTFRNSMGDFKSNAFACIVFALRLIPAHSAWLLRALAGREIVPANKLEPTKISHSIAISGIGVLESPHPQGPLGEVNRQFRKFMLKQGGVYLNCVIWADLNLGAELLLALTIAPPNYRYENYEDDFSNDDWGTSGSHDIDVCASRFPPLFSILERDEVIGVNIVITLSTVVTEYWHKHRWSKGQLEGSLKTDTDGITLMVNGQRKFFKGGRHALYWHRKYPFGPRILACFLMTLERV